MILVRWRGGDFGATKGARNAAGGVDLKDTVYTSPAKYVLAGKLDGVDFVRPVVGE